MRVKAIKSDCDGAMNVVNVSEIFLCSVSLPSKFLPKIDFVFFFGKTIFKINLSPSRKFFIHVILLSWKVSLEEKVFRFSLYHASVSNALYFKYTSSKKEEAKKKNETKLSLLLPNKKKRKLKRKAIFH
jgi:hypothetical protein